MTYTTGPADTRRGLSYAPLDTTTVGSGRNRLRAAASVPAWRAYRESRRHRRPVLACNQTRGDRRRRLRGHDARDDARAPHARDVTTSRSCSSRRARTSRRSPSSTSSPRARRARSSPSCGTRDIFRGLPITVRLRPPRVACTRPRTRVDRRTARTPTATIPYWRLVIATGAIAYVPPVPGLAEHADHDVVGGGRPGAAARASSGSSSAPPRCTTAHERERALSFTVVGGGATGVEIIGTIAAVLPRMIRSLGLRPRRAAAASDRGPARHPLRPARARSACGRGAASRRWASSSCSARSSSSVEDGCAYIESGRAIDADGARLVRRRARRPRRGRVGPGVRQLRPPRRATEVLKATVTTTST